jgi:TonB family protein
MLSGLAGGSLLTGLAVVILIGATVAEAGTPKAPTQKNDCVVVFRSQSCVIVKGDKPNSRKKPTIHSDYPYDKPHAVNEVVPDYPKEALAKKIGGRVTVQVKIVADGTVEEAKILKSDNSVFDEVCIKASRGFRYCRNVNEEGEPVTVYWVVTFTFSPERANAG